MYSDWWLSSEGTTIHKQLAGTSSNRRMGQWHTVDIHLVLLHQLSQLREARAGIHGPHIDIETWAGGRK